MPPSQLKRLKASLREEGLVGTQQSKKQRQKAKGNGSSHDRKAQRESALRSLREQYNPFELQYASRGREKFEVTGSRTGQDNGAKAIKGRPGIAKGLGEQNRRRTLLVEMQRRKKVGGILDKRFGENDPSMTPEERVLERFTREKQQRLKNSSTFDLENGVDEEDHHLTHFGESLALNGNAVDDFDDADLVLSEENDTDNKNASLRKRRHSSVSDDTELELRDAESGGSARRKSKAEVMKEVMAKSKLYKYERQQAKDEDEEAREEIDRELPELFALLNGTKIPPPAKQRQQDLERPIIDAGRAALINGGKPKADKDYDEQLRQMVFDKRSQPSERTKTEDEKAADESRRLKELEEQRLRRMRGDVESEDEELGVSQIRNDGPDVEYNDAEAFGLGSVGAPSTPKHILDVEDEDSFVIENELVDSASEFELSDIEKSDIRQDEDEEDREFLGDLFQSKGTDSDGPIPISVDSLDSSNFTTQSLPFTYPCPQTHREFLEILEDIPFEALPTVIQRIRALYHPKLKSENNVKLGKFASILVDHITYLANDSETRPSAAVVIQTVIRHLHSLAKTYAEEVGTRFRYHLKNLSKTRSTALTKGDLMLLTAISSIFSTSDHFHSVVTPANLCMTRYMAHKPPSSVDDLISGAYLSTLCLHYQRISKRYIPEVLNYTLTALYALHPTKTVPETTDFFFRECDQGLRIETGQDDFSNSTKSLDFFSSNKDGDSIPFKKIALTRTFLTLLEAMIDMWKDKSSILEVINAAIATTRLYTKKNFESKLPSSIKTQSCKLTVKLKQILKDVTVARRPLELHHHRPLAIKASIPKFEETYNPDKHYDPDRERAESSKLKAEHKRERKGALRELRKDANFIARESLREKKERDRKYEEKYKKLVAEIQGEEGREANEYEREKRLRKKKR